MLSYFSFYNHHMGFITYINHITYRLAIIAYQKKSFHIKKYHSAPGNMKQYGMTADPIYMIIFSYYQN